MSSSTVFAFACLYPCRALAFAHAHSSDRKVFERLGNAAKRRLSDAGDDGASVGDEGIWSQRFVTRLVGVVSTLRAFRRRGVSGGRVGEITNTAAEGLRACGRSRADTMQSSEMIDSLRTTCRLPTAGYALPA
ncbi:hypothetical protein WOLCODRAFT_22353 [Wolfiporia cocos MD-104 SS10]|uniref:Secreted protein n=1 Tax=Wolfiporia cocos (strain MD-104) TaxID=742152 RepID=A0A2H3IWY2_WOLCO|nr:hypothetical protein WOLCODRAFT_22353 [Wolfiporia cocos MD-104 SS10]